MAPYHRHWELKDGESARTENYQASPRVGHEARVQNHRNNR